MSEQEESDNRTHPRARARLGGPMTPQEIETARAKFIASFRTEANVSLACARARIARSTAYEWRENDPEFAALWQDAEQDANDAIRREMYRRGVEGWDEPVVSAGMLVLHQGKPVTIKRYSDTLIMALAKARMPEFRDKQSLDVYTHMSQMAEQAKEGMLADLEVVIANESKDQSDQSKPDA